MQTVRALRADRSQRAWLAVVLVAVFGFAWFAWMLLAEVPVYQTSASARLEVLPGPSQIGSQVAGRVARSSLQVGKRVAAGDVLVELDAETQRVELARAREQLVALTAELEALDREIAAETDAATAGDSASRAIVREQLARQRALDTEIEHAEAELAREVKLAASGATPTIDVDNARAELAKKLAARDTLRHASEGVLAAERSRQAGRQARTAELERQRANVVASKTAASAEIARLELEVERHIVRAPISGVLGTVTVLQPGAVVASGTPVATIVPDGELQVVAELVPAAIGRVSPGQHGRLKLDGFPWTRWGTVPARVVRVANEVRDGRIRVELAIESQGRIPLVHGMTGSVDIEVERVSPVTLVLRSLVEPEANAE